MEVDLEYAQHKVSAFLRSLREPLLQKSKEAYSVFEKTSSMDVVTDVDREIEEKIRTFIINLFPDHEVVGEEQTFSQEEPQPVNNDQLNIWYVDPIDGTINFMCQKQFFCVSIAYYHNNVPTLGWIYDVYADELYTGMKGKGAYLNNIRLKNLGNSPIEESLIAVNHRTLTYLNRQPTHINSELLPLARGFRNYGCASLEMAFVARGLLGLYASKTLSPWDYASGKLILEEVGGIATTIEGEKLSMDCSSTHSILCANPRIYNQLQKNEAEIRRI